MTKSPELPLPIFSCAVEKTSSLLLYNINSPDTAGFKVTASTGQTNWQTPQPSQAKGLTWYLSSAEIALNLQFVCRDHIQYTVLNLSLPLVNRSNLIFSLRYLIGYKVKVRRIYIAVCISLST